MWFFNSFLNIYIVLEFLMSNGKVFQRFCAATPKAREVEDNFVRGMSTKCSLSDRNVLVGK